MLRLDAAYIAKIPYQADKELILDSYLNEPMADNLTSESAMIATPSFAITLSMNVMRVITSLNNGKNTLQIVITNFIKYFKNGFFGITRTENKEKSGMIFKLRENVYIGLWKAN